MNFDVSYFSFGCNGNSSEQKQSTIYAIVKNRSFIALFLFSAIFQLAGCVSDKVDKQSDLTFYQRAIADQGPQHRVDTEGQNPNQSLGLLRPTASPTVMTDPNTGQKTILGSGVAPPGLLMSEALAAIRPDVKIVTDPNTGKKSVTLTIEQAIARTLANSSEIRVISFDPSIAKQDITKTSAEFDLTFFGSYNYEDEANPPNSIFQPGESDVRTVAYGFRQRGVTGSEWSLSHVLTRSWDDLIGGLFLLAMSRYSAFK